MSNAERIIDVEVIEDAASTSTNTNGPRPTDSTTSPPGSRPWVSEIPLRAARTLDAVADVIQPFLPEHAETLHGHARTGVATAASVEKAVAAGSDLVDTVRDAAGRVGSVMKKLGIQPGKFGSRSTFRSPRPSVNDLRDRYRAARAAAQNEAGAAAPSTPQK